MSKFGHKVVPDKAPEPSFARKFMECGEKTPSRIMKMDVFGRPRKDTSTQNKGHWWSCDPVDLSRRNAID